MVRFKYWNRADCYSTARARAAAPRGLGDQCKRVRREAVIDGLGHKRAITLPTPVFEPCGTGRVAAKDVLEETVSIRVVHPLEVESRAMRLRRSFRRCALRRRRRDRGAHSPDVSATECCWLYQPASGETARKLRLERGRVGERFNSLRPPSMSGEDAGLRSCSLQLEKCWSAIGRCV